MTGIHSGSRQQYPDGMAAPDSMLPDPRPFAIRTSWLLLILLANVCLFLAGLRLVGRHNSAADFPFILISRNKALDQAPKKWRKETQN